MRRDRNPLFRYDLEIEKVVVEHHCTRRGHGEDGRMYRVLGVRWRIEVIEPLTVTPAIQCPYCGLRGFIAGGMWRNV